MATKQVTFRIDEELKKEAETVFEEMGISMTTALNAFVKATVREGKMPFELVSDEYAYRKMVREKLQESLDESAKDDAKWLSQDDVFGKFRKKYQYDV